jgi:hypothetical protein
MLAVAILIRSADAGIDFKTIINNPRTPAAV